MASLPRPLPPLSNGSIRDLDELPAFRPHFFVPRLKDKPQNPIIDALPFYHRSKKPHATPELRTLPKELLILSEQLVENKKGENDREIGIEHHQDEETDPENLWSAAGSKPRSCKHHILSWGTVLDPNRTTLSPFLSEQPLHVFVAARHHVSPHLYDPEEYVIYISPEELLDNLKITLTGCSSSLHIWNAKTERFETPCVSGTQRTTIVMVGMDEVATDSYMSRYLEIGVLLRRLETFVLLLRKQRSGANSAIHAFTHALSTVLIYIRESILKVEPGGLTSFWASLEDTHVTLMQLANLCRRTVDINPSHYDNLLWPAHQLLSHIYDHVCREYERASPKTIRAIFAYILTLSSRPYFRDISLSVGFGGVPEFLSRKMSNQKFASSELDALDDDDEESTDDDDLDLLAENSTEDLATFLRGEPADTIFRTRKSLRILYAASPDHPIFTQPRGFREVQWFWTGDSLLELLNDECDSNGSVNVSVNMSRIESSSRKELPYAGNYKLELQQFRLFDLEPGIHLDVPKYFQEKSFSVDPLPIFIDTFPDTLPSFTPTFALLSRLVLKPLLVHCQGLNKQTIQVFMGQNTLHLRTHLILLRSYLMLTLHAFKSRLSAALFTDVDHVTTTRKSIALRAPSTLGQSIWAVGLASGLTERNSWPPGGSDLSFYLRTVIMDSLQSLRNTRSDGHHSKVANSTDIWEDIESKLGFAIRDLPLGAGRDKWLDPNAIEALDFLFLDYKPQRPLSCFISPDVLSKYQRIFTFLLRLLRVENVTRLIFRMTHVPKDPLFQTLTKSNAMLLHFTFLVHSFVQTLSSYIYDVAIGGHFNTFLFRVALSEKAEFQHGSLQAFTDVVSLAKHHSEVMDNILSSCLLRSGQKPISDTLRICLETILELGVLVGGLRYGRMKEYEAAHQVEDLYKKFLRAVTNFVKILGKNVTENAGFLETDLIYLEKSIQGLFVDGENPVATDATASLHQLLVRLDYSNWWKHRGQFQ